MQETIFSKIISKEIPADIVYEDADVIAFFDINPVHLGHTLVVPKKWSRNVLDIESASWSKVMEVVRILTPVIKKVTHADGLNIIMNIEPSGNQAVFHSHIHIVPRYENDQAFVWPKGTSHPKEESKEMLKKIKELL
jgi:histidine triad (HIT) family protein